MGSNERIETGARTHIDDLFAFGELPQRKRVCDAGKGLNGDVG